MTSLTLATENTPEVSRTRPPLKIPSRKKTAAPLHVKPTASASPHDPSSAAPSQDSPHPAAASPQEPSHLVVAAAPPHQTVHLAVAPPHVSPTVAAPLTTPTTNATLPPHTPTTTNATFPTQVTPTAAPPHAPPIIATSLQPPKSHLTLETTSTLLSSYHGGSSLPRSALTPSPILSSAANPPHKL